MGLKLYPADNGSGDKLADNVLHFGRVRDLREYRSDPAGYLTLLKPSRGLD